VLLLRERLMKPCSGHIFQMQRWSINDGEGIRTTVFLKGCPLRCRWCANPESWKHEPEILFFPEKCTGCGACAQVCNAGAIAVDGFVREKCCGCGQCSEVCPTGVRKKIGSRMTVDEVIKVIKRDAIFYRESGGGVTFSGGEPFAQPEFLRQLVKACYQLGLDTAVETSGYFEWEQVQDIFTLLDCVFVDIKHMDEEFHKQMTGVSNRRILENIISISKMHSNTIIRVPLISGVNDQEENIRQMCESIFQHTRVAGIEILPYHDFGEGKFSAIGAVHQTFTTPDRAHLETVKKIITDYGIPVLDFK